MTMLATQTTLPAQTLPYITAEDITARRRRCGLSQNRLAQLAAMNPCVVSRILSGQKPLTQKTAMRLDAVLRGFEYGLEEAEMVMRKV